MTAAADRLRQHGCFCGNCPSPSDCEGRDLALLCADMADTLEKHGSAMPRGQYVNHAEADALLARLSALSDTQEPA